MEKKLEAEPIIEVDAPRRLPGHANCGCCFYSKLEPQPGGKLDINLRTCYRGPPSAQVVFQQVQTPLGVKMAQQIISCFPPVQARQRCHEWAPQDRDEHVIAALSTPEGKAN